MSQRRSTKHGLVALALPQALAHTAWGLAKLKEREKRKVQVLAAELGLGSKQERKPKVEDAREKLSELDARHLSYTARSLATLRASDRSFWDTMGRAIECAGRRRSFPAKDVAGIM